MAIALKRSPVIESVDVLGRSAFCGLEEEWNTLVSSTVDAPFHRHEFIRIWLDNFEPEAELDILTGRDSAGRLIAVLPLMKTRDSILGLSARMTVSTANTHSCRFDMVARDGIASGKAFFERMEADKTWDVIRLADVPEGGIAWHLYRAAEDAGYPVGAWESQRSPYLPLPSSYEELLNPMSSGFKANLRLRRRRLEAMGAVTVERVTGGPDLYERLGEAFEIEQSGWKGLEGTAILQDSSVSRFYTGLADAAALRKYLSLYFLRLDGKAVAFHYGLTCGGVYYMPKLGYDESLKECSPGLLLLEEILKDCIARGLTAYEFLGADVEWKTKWSGLVRPHHWLYIFRNSMYGRALHAAKFKVIPSAKRLMGNRNGSTEA